MNKALLILCCILTIASADAQTRNAMAEFPELPTIIAGTSKITGRIRSPNDTNQDSIFVKIGVPLPISGEYAKYKVLVDRSGKFSIDVNVETDVSLIGLSSSVNPYKSLLIKLTSRGITNIDVVYNSNFDIEKIDVSPSGLTQDDMSRSVDVVYKMIDYRPNRAPEPLYAKSTDYFMNHVKNSISERLQILERDSLISRELKGSLSRDFRLLLYNAHVFDYKREMTLNYQNTNANDGKMPDIQSIDKTYFRFLKDFNLNNPQYLYCSTFHEFQTAILQNETLGLPEIGERDISSWLASVKVILADLIGFNDGQYYDVLAANAYARQLNEEVKPLTIKQEKNIAKYWKKGEIAKILFRKNEQVLKLYKGKSPAVINEISSVPDDKVVETIVSKHKNKVVFLDLWATWCAPCLDAMQQFKEAKNEFLHKDVVFVYLTNSSSPRRLWEEKIKGIGNEHYYLTDTQWEYIMNQYGFEGIPSYLLFDKEGTLINKFTAFPENEKVKKMINGLL